MQIAKSNEWFFSIIQMQISGGILENIEQVHRNQSISVEFVQKKKLFLLVFALLDNQKCNSTQRWWWQRRWFIIAILVRWNIFASAFAYVLFFIEFQRKSNVLHKKTEFFSSVWIRRKAKSKRNGIQFDYNKVYIVCALFSWKYAAASNDPCQQFWSSSIPSTVEYLL